jgi:lysophospholipase L1-like esterase
MSPRENSGPVGRSGPPPLLWGLFLGPVALFWIDSGLALGRGWSPAASRLERVVLIVALLLTVALVAAFALTRVRDRLARAWPRLAALAIGLVVAFTAAEVALGALGDRLDRAPYHGHPRGLRQTFEPRIPGTSPIARFSVNSRGLRGTEPPADAETFRILCVGGSTTEDVYLDDEKTWTRLLAEKLQAGSGRRYWSASAGRSGFATAEHLRFLEQGSVPDEFDAVILVVGINDLARLVWGESAEIPVAAVKASRAPLWARSRLIELLRRIEGRRHPANLVMDREALFVRDAQTRRNEARTIDGEIDIEPALAAYRARLEASVGAARARGLEVVLADQPTLFRADLSPEEEKRLWFLRRSDGTFLPPGRMRELMDRFNAVTADVAVATGAHFVPLSEMNGEASYFYDECHFSEAGAEAVAVHLANGVNWKGLAARDR